MEKDVKKLIALATGDQLSYNERNKREFHRLGKKVLKEIATRMGLTPGKDCDVSSNLGGIAVSGEITLHSDT